MAAKDVQKKKKNLFFSKGRAVEPNDLMLATVYSTPQYKILNKVRAADAEGTTQALLIETNGLPVCLTTDSEYTDIFIKPFLDCSNVAVARACATLGIGHIDLETLLDALKEIGNKGLTRSLLRLGLERELSDKKLAFGEAPDWWKLLLLGPQTLEDLGNPLDVIKPGDYKRAAGVISKRLQVVQSTYVRRQIYNTCPLGDSTWEECMLSGRLEATQFMIDYVEKGKFEKMKQEAEKRSKAEELKKKLSQRREITEPDCATPAIGALLEIAS